MNAHRARHNLTMYPGGLVGQLDHNVPQQFNVTDRSIPFVLRLCFRNHVENTNALHALCNQTRARCTQRALL